MLQEIQVDIRFAALDLSKKNLFVKGVDRHNVDFILSFPRGIPPGTDFRKVAAFPKLRTEPALEHMAAGVVRQFVENFSLQSGGATLLDETQIRINESEPEVQVVVSHHKAKVPCVLLPSNRILALDEMEVVLELKKLPADIRREG